jgi:hypothetical protein
MQPKEVESWRFPARRDSGHATAQSDEHKREQMGSGLEDLKMIGDVL